MSYKEIARFATYLFLCLMAIVAGGGIGIVAIIAFANWLHRLGAFS